MASSSVASAGSFSITSRTFCLALPADIGASLAALSSTVRITESDGDRGGKTAYAANVLYHPRDAERPVGCMRKLGAKPGPEIRKRCLPSIELVAFGL